MSHATAGPSQQPLPVVVHRFTALGCNGEEVCLSPALAFLEFAAEFCGADGMRFAEAALPEVAALGMLPAGFVDGKRIGTEPLLQLARRHLGSALATPEAADPPEVEAWAAWIEEVCAAALTFTLWVHTPSFQSHTRPCIMRGVRGGVASRALATVFCQQQRKVARRQSALTSWKQRNFGRPLMEDLRVLLAEVQSRLSSQRFLHGKRPQLSDVVLFCHAQALLAVPHEVAPWNNDELRKYLSCLEAYCERFGTPISWKQGATVGPHISSWAKSAMFNEGHGEWEADTGDVDADTDDDAESMHLPKKAPSKVVVAKRQGIAHAPVTLDDNLPVSPRSRIARSSSFGSWLQRCKTSGSGFFAATEPSTDPAPTSSGREPEAISRARWRNNVLFLAWCAASMGAVSLWKMRRSAS